ncbi:MAG: 16S rRNA (cytidine(1402)-2'-O)-methyltransferase [Coriobacteriales bacterium]|nr:16S rRNA (cytidine(1402)-2'-O)-methyltransferase [Coriobacteriales bacterium]
MMAAREPQEVSGELDSSRHVLIALGSNMGDAAATLDAAVERLGQVAGLTVLAVSPLYRSEPAYLDDQAEFCNAVLLAEFEFAEFEQWGQTQEPAPFCPTPALCLLHELQAVEQEFGRVRTVANGPRTLDVDIIDIEGVTSADPELVLPHPRALERDFVVTPLLDVAPGHVLASGTPVTRDAIAYGRVLGKVDRASANPVAPPRSAPASPSAAAHTHNTSAPNAATGILSICATPIGNLGDLTLRVIDTLKAASLILAEDTRVARRLLTHLGIHAKVERCDENTIRQRSPRIIEQLRQGARIAYVSDAGTPGIADPGAHLVAAVRQAGLALEVLPGPSAVLTALVASGFEATSFYFGGFLPRKRAQATATLKSLATLDAALVFFESPHRTAASLAVIAELFPEREVTLARELTKLHEEVLRAPAPQLARQIAEREQGAPAPAPRGKQNTSAPASRGGQAVCPRPLKGEVVLVIAPPDRRQAQRRVHKDKYGKE